MIPQTLGTYVYLASLEQEDAEFAAAAKSYSTFNDKTAVNSKKQDISPIHDAIAALKNIANTERQKEQAAIKGYLNEIKQYVANSKDTDSPLIQSLNKQIAMLSSYDFSDVKNSQMNLINAINITKQNLNVYSRRLTEIASATNEKAQEKLKDKRYNKTVSARQEFRLQSDLEQFLLTGDKSGTQRNKKLKEQLQKQLSAEFKQVPVQLREALLSALFVDFNRWAEDLIEGDRRTSFKRMKVKDIESYVQQYYDNMGQEGLETHFQRLMRESSKEFIAVLNDMNKAVHGKYINAQYYDALKKEIDISKQKSSKNVQVFNEDKYTIRQAQAMVDSYDAEINKGANRERFTITFHTATSHGNFLEAIQRIFSRSIDVSANVGADNIATLGTVTFTPQQRQQNDKLTQLSEKINHKLSDHFNKRKTITIKNFESFVKQEQLVSKQIAKDIKKTEKDLSSLSSISDKFFITHESLKLWKTQEAGGSDITEFDGRDMNALSVLTKLYSSDLSLSMMDPYKLMTFLINIDPATLAGANGENKSRLETYFSIFAGLLMFDDIKDIAAKSFMEVKNNIQLSTVNQVHLYNINGIYFPISVILDNLIEQSATIETELTVNNTKTATATIKQQFSVDLKGTTLADWEKNANKTISSTSIQISFFSGFMNYISSLFNNFNGIG